MAKLSSQHQRAVVVKLAQYERPAEVQRYMRETFGVEMTLPQVLYYDPDSAGTELSPTLTALFRSERERAQRDVESSPLAHLAVRLRELWDLYLRAKKAGNLPLAASLLEQAGKDAGGMFSNLRRLEMGDPVDGLAKLLGLAPDEVRAMVGMGDAGE